jgi:DNA-binding SARP family transcriptional activator
MEFRILGPLDVRDGDQAVELAGGKQRALLALLIVNANETVSTDRIVDELWGERSPQTAPKVIQNHVSQLRRGLGDGLLVTEGTGYRLRVEPGSVDVDRFEELVAEGRSALDDGDAEAAAGSFRESLALWRGSPLADVAFEPFAQAEIARLEERRLVAVEERIDADLALGRHEDLVGELESLVAKHPLRERLRAQLMLALYRSGRQSEALAAYQEARSTLVEELGIEPERPLRELHQAILNQDPGLDPTPATELPSEDQRGGFVGRAAELTELVSRLEDALSGHGRLVLLVGEPGIGKSRLADEVIRRSRARGATVLTGRCWEAGGAPPYWPWVQSLRAYVREADPSTLRAQLGAGAPYLVQLLPELRDRFADVAEPVSLESEGDRFRLFDAVAEFLRNAAQDTPIVLILDDLHAADTPSLLLLQFVARELGSMRVLLVGACRDVDPTPKEPLTLLLGALASEPVAHRISLRGFSRDEVAEYVELAAAEIASPTLASALHDETEGNPLFVGETVRLLAAEGGTGVEPALVIPQTVRDVIARRLARLSDECNRVLVLASILGREFELVGLAGVSGVSEEELLETLDEAMVARVVSDIPGAQGRLRFGHVLIRDSLYEGLTSLRRVYLHRRALEALEGLYGPDPGPHLAELALHAVSGGELEKAIGYARSAGDRALAEYAYEEGVRQYDTALDGLRILAPDDDATRCGLLLSKGRALAQVGNTPLAKETFLEAAEIARRLGLAPELAQAAAGYGGWHMWGRTGSDTRLVPLLEEALDGLDPEEAELRARLLARLAGALRDEHSRERRDRLSAEALEAARRSGNAGALLYALDGRSAAIIGPDTVGECLEIANEFCAIAEQGGDLERSLPAFDHRRTVLVITGDLQTAQLDLARELEIAEILRQPAQLWQAYAASAMFALLIGPVADAEPLIARAFEFGETSMPDTAVPTHRLQRYWLADFQGWTEEVVPELADLAHAFPARVAFRCALAHAHARVGNVREARKLVTKLQADRFSALPFDQEWLWAMSLLAETVVWIGDVEAAEVLYELVVPWVALNASDHPEGFRGSVSRDAGLLASLLNRPDEAAGHFEDAILANTKIGARVWVAHAQSDYGRLLLERGQSGDTDRAEELLSSALDLSDELGLSALADRIRAV